MRIGSYPQSEILNRQGAMNAKTEIAHWAKTDELAEGPKSALSHSPVERSGHRILGDPGTQRWRWVIMAVQGFSGSGIIEDVHWITDVPLILEEG